MSHLTETQSEIVNFVRQYLEQNSRAPTYSEIGDGIGVAVRAIQYQLDKLEEAGVVSRDRNASGRVVPRSISVLEAA